MQTTADIDRIIAHTQCDGVMIGRGAIGNPWIFSHKNIDDVSHSDKLQMVLKHSQLNKDFYGETIGVRLFRKHSNRYIANTPKNKAFRHQILTCETIEELKNLYQHNFI